MTQDTNAVPKLRKLAAYLKEHPELVQIGGRAGQYPAVCILGALAEANGADLSEDADPAYHILSQGATQELWWANDKDGTDFPTFRHFIDSTDDDTLADMMASLEETE